MNTMTSVLLANRLRDGAVVYLANDQTWTEGLAQAKRLQSDDDETHALETGQAAVANNVVVAPELIQLDGDAPARFKEHIRAVGPTVRLDLNRSQASTLES